MDNGTKLDLGPCCMCTGPGAINLVMLRRRAPVAGHGWGCVVCNLPADGATAVLCGDCMDIYQDNPDLLGFCCRGYPKTEGRIALGDLPEGVFDHDNAKHLEEEALPW